MQKVSDFFEVFPRAAIHGYPVQEWMRVVWDFQQSPGVFGRPRPRLEAFYGPSDYSYSVKGTCKHPGVIKAAITHANKLAGVTFNSCLAVLYRDGSDSVSWHSDDESDMGPVVLSISYGATRRFSVRPKGGGEVVNFDLNHKDVLLMRAGAQDHFEHCLRKTSRPVGPRICLTFRELRC